MTDVGVEAHLRLVKDISKQQGHYMDSTTKRFVAAVPVALAGACLGFWMFGLRGLLLFMGVGLVLILVFGVLAQMAPRAAAGLTFGERRVARRRVACRFCSYARGCALRCTVFGRTQRSNGIIETAASTIRHRPPLHTLPGALGW